MKQIILDYFQLTKPPIMLLVVFSSVTALFMEGSLVHKPLEFILVLLGVFLSGGSANALNQYFEREIDAKMTRTMKRRPLPLGKMDSRNALIFSVVIGILGVMIFLLFFNILSALLSLGTILFYSLFYTLWLKPNTPQNIVIGGIAGAMPPVIAWVAASNNILSGSPWVLFLIIFFWTPPHFWALALYFKDDYEKTNLPMLPVVKGVDSTLRQIFIYTLILVGVTLVMLAFSENRWVYLVVSIALGALFIKKSYDAKKLKTPELQKKLFGYSIVYLFSLFFALIIDSLIF